MFKLINKRVIHFMLVIFISTIIYACQSSDSIFDEIDGYNSGLEDIIDQSMYRAKVDNIYTDDEEDFVDSELNDFLPKNTANVVFSNNGALISNEVEETDIYMENGNLIVDSTKKMTLVVSGTLNGSIIVNKSDGKFKLILDGVTITSESGPAINLQTEKRSFIVINDNTTNYVTDGEDHPLMNDGSKTKAAIFSEEQLIISGNGTLYVTARHKHGIASDDYLKILSGQIHIMSTISDGLRANDYVVIDGGHIEINSDGDGIEVERGYIVINGGILIINSKGNGLKTTNQRQDPEIIPFISINHGYIEIHSEKKGIISEDDVILNNGAIKINSIGDAVSAEGIIEIVDGMYYFHSAEKQTVDGDNGVHFIGGTSIHISDGTEYALKSNDGDIFINGGTVIIAGALDININDSQQGYLKLGNIQKNEILQIKDENSLMVVAFINAYTHVILSSSNIISNNEYHIYTGGYIEGNNFYGFYMNGSYEEGYLRSNTTAN
jgi:hypothetical protein